MKAASVVALCTLFWRLAAATLIAEERFGAAAPPAPVVAASPAPAGAPGPGPAAIEALEVKFEITNYNYYDLEKEALIQLGALDASQISHREAQSSAQSPIPDTKETLFGALVAEVIGKVFDDLLREELGSAVGPAPGPAAAPKTPPGLAMLNMAGAPAPGVASSPSGATDDAPVNIFVTFKPGEKYKIEKETESFLQVASVARTTYVQVQITDKPMTGQPLVEQAKAATDKAIKDGTLKRDLVNALKKATSLKPRIIFAGQIAKMRMIPEWSEVTCESHLEKVVRMFEVAYTRRMVPMALYNECTNFIPALSFSHDNIHSPLDKKKCRRASLKFAKRWNFNKASWKYGTSKKHEKMDYTAFCHDICEIRYGNGAPKCNVP
jgi:hypothetical protein